MANIFEIPQLNLAKPQKDYYSVLINVKDFQSKIYLNNISEISFRIYEYENNDRNDLYDELEETQLIQANDFDVKWFQIAKVNETKGDDIPVAYKDVNCNSLEDELISKTVYDLDGVFSLYNLEDISKSIMHIITNEISWNIGYISPSLASLYRVLSIDSNRIYSLLTGDLSKSFNCIFTFNREYKTINAYSLDEIGELTDIIISEQNLLKSWEKSSDKDKIITKMRVIGGTSTDGTIFDIRKVNFGSDTITNYSYFKSRMSTQLQTALSNWENSIDSNTSSYNTNLALLKTYNSDLNTLNSQLIEIKTQISAQEDVLNVSLKLHSGNPPLSSNSDYTNYQNAINQLVTLNTQKANKEIEISNKNIQINSVNSILNAISSNVDKSNFFNSELLDELDCFTYVGDDYTDDTFLATSETTSDQEIEMALELKSNAEKEINIVCRPQPEFKATLKNLWSIHDEKDCVISYSEWIQNFKVGNIITVILNDNSWTTIRIIGIELDYNDPENSNVTFSTKTRLDSSTYNLGEIQAQASRAYSSVNMNKYSWTTAGSQSSLNEEFRTGVLNATLNKMVSDEHSQVETGEFGIKIRPWIESEKAYGLYGMWLNPYRMLFTNDGFLHANSAFGLLTLPDGTQRMGINTDVIYGNFVLTSNLTISNNNNSIVMNENGASFVNCGITINKGVNTLTLNATDGIKLTKSGVSQFYIDGSGDLSLAGKIIGGSINIGSNRFIVDSNGLVTINSNGLVVNSSNFTLTASGNLTCSNLNATNANISGNISSSSITGSSFSSTSGAYSMLLNSANINFSTSGIELILNTNVIGWNRSDSTLVTYLYPTYMFTPELRTEKIVLTGSSQLDISGTVSFSGNIICSSINSQNISGRTLITNSNISSYIPSTSSIDADVISSSYIQFSGGRAAGYQWCLDTFQQQSSSDKRLKDGINDLDDSIDAFYFNLKPKTYKFKIDDNYVHVGLLAQDVKQSLLDSGLPENYAIFKTRPIREYTDERLYVDDEVLRVEYEELTTMTVYEVHKLKVENFEFRKELDSQTEKIAELSEKLIQLQNTL